MRSLRLTSPLMHGPDVRELQKLLRSSKWGNFHPGPIDGEFGERTANAVWRAKWALGYPTDMLNKIAGRRLHAILDGSGPLPHDFLERRKKRLGRTTVQKQFRGRVVAYAKTQVGTLERPPGSNQQKYGEFWHENGVAWCGLFGATALHEAGADITQWLALQIDYVPTLVSFARHNQYRFRIPGTPQAGDLACFDFDGNGVHDHVGIVLSVDHRAGTVTVGSIDGNTAKQNSGGSDANGGGVWPRTRTLPVSRVTFVRYDYKPKTKAAA